MRHAIPAVVLLALTGCNPPTAELPALHPTTGTLTRDGKPVNGGALRFHATDGGDTNTIVSAEVSNDGTFSVHTVSGAGKAVSRSPGAPTGKYHVTYTPPATDQQGAMPMDISEPVTIEPKVNVFALKLPK